MLVWKILCGVLFVASLLLLLLHKLPRRKLKVKAPSGPKLEEIRADSLHSLAKLMDDYRTGRITNRAAYQRLSGIVRSFVHGATGLKVTNCTFEEIKALNMPRLTALVHDYYEPEFAYDSAGEFMRSHRTTSELIAGWR